MKLLNIARCAGFVSYMATHLQLLFLISKSLNGTFKIRLQNVVINGVDAMVLGSHEGFSYFPKNSTLHNCCEHCHTYLVLLPLITVCTLRVVYFVTPPAYALCCGSPRAAQGSWCASPDVEG